MNIFVGNLSFEAKKEDVYQVFAAFGAVSSVEIVMEKKGKKSRGFGFLEMPNEQEALSAIAALNGKEILGRPINVMPSLPKKPKKEFSSRDNEPGLALKRTGKYREGRRTISYMKKRLGTGITAPVAERKYKPNPMRWRKKPRWAASSQKPEGELKPWQRPQGESKPWEKSRGGPKPWQKSEGVSKPWQKRTSAKPWRKSSDSRRQSDFKKRKSPVSHKK
ncbi:MAG: RNA-binding protein [Candidatus Omnitrophica bacterium]|nr:RNA-binding protein [Candidatus Omnitrophota bacterium]